MTRASTAFALWWILTMACTRNVPRGEPPDVTTGTCVRWSYNDRGVRRVAMACVETPGICAKVVRLLNRYGSLGGVERIGACR